MARAAQDRAIVTYTGKLKAGGAVFDDNHAAGKTPLAFQIGSGSEPLGLENGVREMSAGETAEVCRGAWTRAALDYF